MEPEEQRTLIIAAHPDDETIGAGIWMSRHKRPEQITVVHVTDGAPRGHQNREEYARDRRRELVNALNLVGIRQDQCLELGHVDQEACLHLPELVKQIRSVLEALTPDLVLTHPYEGGHPDHDAAAFAVAHATGGDYLEFTSYHRATDDPGSPLTAGRFLQNGPPAQTICFTAAERELKQRMLASFPTQQEILKLFSPDCENFRPAPAYDFTAPPHAGELQYEAWGMISGENWRRFAREAIQRLGTWETAV